MDALREFWEFVGYIDTAGAVVVVTVLGAVRLWRWRTKG